MKKLILPVFVAGIFLLHACSKPPSAEKYAGQWCEKLQQGLQFTKEGKYDEATAAFGEMDELYTETSKKFGDDRKFMEEFQRLTRECKNKYAPERK